MTKHHLPIVGDHFRPPAKAILAVLPLGTRLYLVAEPTNQYDPNAVKVVWQTVDFPHTATAAFDEAGRKFGYDTAELLQNSEYHLGYIPRGEAEALAGKFSPDTPIVGKLSSLTTGKPAIVFSLED